MIPVRRRAGLALATFTLTAGLVPALATSASTADEPLDLTPLSTGCQPRWTAAPGYGESRSRLTGALDFIHVRQFATAAGGWSAGLRGEKPARIDMSTSRWQAPGKTVVQGYFPGGVLKTWIADRAPGNFSAYHVISGATWEIPDPDEWAAAPTLAHLGRPGAHYLYRPPVPGAEEDPIAFWAVFPTAVPPMDGTGVVEESTDDQGRTLLCEWDSTGQALARYALDSQDRLITVLKPWGVLDATWGPQQIDLPAASDTVSWTAYWSTMNDVYARANAGKVAQEVNTLRGKARATAATLAKATARVVRKPVAGSVRPSVRYRAAVTTVSSASARRGHPWLYRVTINRQGRPVVRKIVT